MAPGPVASVAQPNHNANTKLMVLLMCFELSSSTLFSRRKRAIRTCTSATRFTSPPCQMRGRPLADQGCTSAGRGSGAKRSKNGGGKRAEEAVVVVMPAAAPVLALPRHKKAPTNAKGDQQPARPAVLVA